MNPAWTTREGVRMQISDMSTRHIYNCIAMLKRNIDEINAALDAEDYAEDFDEFMADEFMALDLQVFKSRAKNKIRQFLAELRRRGE